MPKEAPSITKTLASLTSLSHSPSHKSKPAPLKIHFPSTQTTVTLPGQHLTKEATSPTPIYSVSATALSHLTFPNCDLSPCTSASTESSLGSNTNPRRNSSSLPTDPSQSTPKYMVVSLDLDAPFPSVPLMSPLLHGLQADLTLATEELDPDDEYIPLHAAASDGSEGEWDAGEVVDYMGPAPPPPSSPHRYVFMLWEQPEGLTRERICEEMGILGRTGEGHEDMGILGRARWDEEGFEKRLGLERIVAGNYFVC